MTGNSQLDQIAQLEAFTSLPDFQFAHAAVRHRIWRIAINGNPKPVLILVFLDFVGWVRFKKGSAVWRYGSLRTGQNSVPWTIGDLAQDGTALVRAIRAAISEVGPQQRTYASFEEAEEFILGVEHGTGLPAGFTPPAAEPPALKFNSRIHDDERNPAAAGFTEQQLDDVPLITVYPAVLPAIIGGFFLTCAILGAPYEFYTVLRWAVTAMAIWMCTIASSQHRTGWIAAFAGIALLFNPLVPVYLTREQWVPLDFIAGTLFAMAGNKLRASRPATRDDRASY